MARVTVEDCLEKVANRFALVILASARTKQLIDGAARLVPSNNKDHVTSLREIAAGKVSFANRAEETITRLHDEKE